MIIDIVQAGDGYRADCKSLPGSPPVGVGKTKEAALCHLFWLLIFQSTSGPNPRTWASLIEKFEPIIINGEWHWLGKRGDG